MLFKLHEKKNYKEKYGEKFIARIQHLPIVVNQIDCTYFLPLCNMCHYLVSNSILFIYLFQIGEISGVVMMHKNN